jgi:hypothetical protein
MTVRSIVAHGTVPLVATGRVATPAGGITSREPIVVGPVSRRAVVLDTVRRTIVVTAMRCPIVIGAVCGTLVAYTAVGTVGAERTRSLARAA